MELLSSIDFEEITSFQLIGHVSSLIGHCCTSVEEIKGGLDKLHPCLLLDATSRAHGTLEHTEKSKLLPDGTYAGVSAMDFAPVQEDEVRPSLLKSKAVAQRRAQYCQGRSVPNMDTCAGLFRTPAAFCW